MAGSEQAQPESGQSQSGAHQLQSKSGQSQTEYEQSQPESNQSQLDLVNLSSVKMKPLTVKLNPDPVKL